GGPARRARAAEAAGLPRRIGAEGRRRAGAASPRADQDPPGAAASLREGMTETLTILRLGVPPTLARTLRSASPVKSMIEICRDHTRDVTRWRDGTMAPRWCAAGMLKAGDCFPLRQRPPAPARLTEFILYVARPGQGDGLLPLCPGCRARAGCAGHDRVQPRRRNAGTQARRRYGGPSGRADPRRHRPAM